MPTHIAVIRPTAATSTATACLKSLQVQVTTTTTGPKCLWTRRQSHGRYLAPLLHNSGWVGSKGSATKFTDDDYYWTLGKCLEVGDVTRKHMDIMDKFDPNKRVALLVDEWGTWWDEEPEPCPVTSISKTQCVTQWWQLCH